MKKKFWVLTMVLVLALSFSACGNKTAGSGRSTSESGNSSNREALKDRVSDSEADEAKNSLSDWYDNSNDRKTAEDFINNMLSGQGMKFFMEVEAPDVLIYNYQYTTQLEVTDLVVEQLEITLDSAAKTVISDMQKYRDAYDVELNVIRVVYLNADGSVIYEKDLTEDYEPSTSSDSTLYGPYADLQEFMESEDAAEMVELTNSLLASSGMTVDFSAEGNTFVYEYYLSDETYEAMGMGDYSGDQLQSYIESVIGSQRDSFESIFTTFDATYGITLDAVRVAFYEEDGTYIISSDILNDAY